VTTEEDNKRLKNDVSEMRARHRLEIDRITSEKEQEMEQLHQRLESMADVVYCDGLSNITHFRYSG